MGRKDWVVMGMNNGIGEEAWDGTPNNSTLADLKIKHQIMVSIFFQMS